MANYFSLGMLERVTRDFIPPESAFNPKGAWENTYRVYALFQTGRQFAGYDVPLGSFRVARTPLDGGSSRLKVEYRKENRRASPHRIAGELECAGDPLATPLGWQFTAGFCSPPQTSVGSLHTKHTMEARGKTIELAGAGFKRTIPRPAAYSSLWALVDAVQRMPRDPDKALRFTFFDLNFTPKPAHLLRYREAAELTFPKAPQRRIRMHAFEQLGEGIVPSIYWTDDSGRLLLFSSGLHGYVLRGGQA